jgi:hypothetical protein
MKKPRDATDLGTGFPPAGLLFCDDPQFDIGGFNPLARIAVQEVVVHEVDRKRVHLVLDFL